MAHHVVREHLLNILSHIAFIHFSGWSYCMQSVLNEKASSKRCREEFTGVTESYSW